MKKFKFRYTPIVWVLLSLVVVFSIVGLALNIYNLVAAFDDGIGKIISCSIIALLTLCLLAFAISLIFYGKYVIKDDAIYSYFGFFKTKIEIKDIVEFTLFKKSNKLVAYFKDDSFTVIVIAPEFYENFVLSVREINPQIFYGTKIDGEDTPA